MTLSRLKPKLRVVGDEGLAIACGTVATREPSRNLRSVSAVPASVNYRNGPSRSFIELTRNIELAEQAPRRFEPTIKAEGDIVL